MSATIFFGLRDTLASVTLSQDGRRVEQIAAFDYAVESLEELRAEGARLGLVLDTAPAESSDVLAALQASGLLANFNPELIVFGSMGSPRVFELAAELSGAYLAANQRLLFTSVDAVERKFAIEAGFEAVPHPILALPALAHPASFRYLRFRVPPTEGHAEWRAALRKERLVPFHVTKEEVYAISDSHVAARLDDLGFWVDRLGAPDEPLSHDLYLLRDDLQMESGFLQPDGNSVSVFLRRSAADRVLCSLSGGLLVSIPAGRSPDSFHFHGARHGHNLKLLPSWTLLDVHAPELSLRGGPTFFAESTLAWRLASPLLAAVVTLDETEKAKLTGSITRELIAGFVDRYSGRSAPTAGGRLIQSRNVDHPDNHFAVDVAADDLIRIGAGRLTVRRPTLAIGGRPFENIEAVLPAQGLDGIVIISAHLDSTGNNDPSYRGHSATAPAPGADDDASGMAGVIGAALAILALVEALPDKPRREIRFLLFNGEEEGFHGSVRYADDQRQQSAPIVGLFQMDMIGYDAKPGRIFEVHGGSSISADLQERSLRLAEIVKACVPLVSSGLTPPQVYPGDDHSDPAEQRSDHYSFHLRNYAACVISEDFFPGPGLAPSPDPNPNYHTPLDISINDLFAADIARAVAAALWFAATR